MEEKRIKHTLLAAAIISGVVLLTACGGATSSGSSSAAAPEQATTAAKEETKPISLEDHGFYLLSASEYSDTAYIGFCGILNNPSQLPTT